jgi:hypothetical protein
VDERENCPCICLDNGEHSRWDQILMCFNAGKKGFDIVLPEGKWQVLVDGRSSCHWSRKKVAEGTAPIAPLSALILGRVKAE